MKIVLIKKNETIVTKNVKNFNYDNIHKYMSFKTNKDIIHSHSWKVQGGYVHIFCKTEGRSNNINKYELPPPIDKPLYYGTLCLIKSTSKKQTNDTVVDMTQESWEKYYNTLMGGFEDINDVDSYESDELDEYPSECLTKEGYLKDGFIIDNDDMDDENVVIDEDEYADEDEEEEEEFNSDEEDSESEEHTDNEVSDEEEYEEEYTTDSDDISELTEEEYTSEDEN